MNKITSTFIGLSLTPLMLMADGYNDYLQGSIQALYTAPQSETFVVKESSVDTVASVAIDVLLLQKYYGGIYVGYTKQLSNDHNNLFIEKKIKDFSLFYRNISSNYEITPYSMYATTIYDGTGSSHTLNVAETVDYIQDRYELRYYGSFKDDSYIGFLAETIQTGVGDKSIRAGLANYYTKAEITNIAITMSIKKRIYLMKDGFDMTGLGADFGYATIQFTGSDRIDEQEMSHAVWAEFAYKNSFDDKRAIAVILDAKATKLGTMIEYGEINLKVALTF